MENSFFYSLGILTLTFITFVVLKLCGVLLWSWWWITAPLWLPIAVLILLIGYATIRLSWAIKKTKKRVLK